MTTLSIGYSTLLALGIGAAVTGCATPGTRPHDMSIAGHETAASAEPGAAAKHHSAAQALRDAQTQACAGVVATESDGTPLFKRADIDGIEPLYEYVGKAG